MPVFPYIPASPADDGSGSRGHRPEPRTSVSASPFRTGRFGNSGAPLRNHRLSRGEGHVSRAARGRRHHLSPGAGGWLRSRRRLAIALLLCLAAGLTVHQLTPAPTRTVAVMAAARDLPAGSTLDPTDLMKLNVAPDIKVAGMFTEPADLAGKQLASPVLRSQILTSTQLLGQGLLAGTPEGTAAVPLRLADPASIQLLFPGQLVNIVSSSDGSYGSGPPSEVLAEAVAVLWTSGKGGQSSEWLGSGETDGLIVVAAGPDQARRLAGASTQGKLFFVMVGPGP